MSETKTDWEALSKVCPTCGYTRLTEKGEAERERISELGRQEAERSRKRLAEREARYKRATEKQREEMRVQDAFEDGVITKEEKEWLCGSERLFDAKVFATMLNTDNALWAAVKKKFGHSFVASVSEEDNEVFFTVTEQPMEEPDGSATWWDYEQLAKHRKITNKVRTEYDQHPRTKATHR